jgi:hypothetical protein
MIPNTMSSNMPLNLNLLPTKSTGSITGLPDSLSGITVFGITALIIYAITKILNFYDIGSNVYGSYLTFYIFLLIIVYNTPSHHIIF